MNLPHQEPILFAKKVIEKQDTIASVLCVFNTPPTLAMFIEASAQSSIALSNSNKEEIGFLVSTKNVKIINTLEDLEYIIKIKKLIEVNNMKQFYFEAYNSLNTLITASGSITIVIQN